MPFEEGNPWAAGPGNKRAAKPDSEKGKPYTLRLYKEDRERLRQLVSSGYAGDWSKAIRQAIREAIEKQI